jgi:hypothetical protein
MTEELQGGAASVTRRDLRSLRGRVFGQMPKKIAKNVAIALLIFSTFGAWAVGSSVGSSPDDQVHMASIWCSSFAGEVCEIDEESGLPLVPSLLFEAMCTTQNPFQSAGCQPLLTLGDPLLVPTKFVNKGLYPPGFYMTMNLFVQENIERAIISMRLFNGALFTVLAVALWWFLPNRLTRPLVWSWVLTLTPLGMFLIPSVNPSSWALISVGFGWLALMGFLESRGRPAIGLAVVYAVTGVMAFSARTDSAVFFMFASALAIFLSPLSLKQIGLRICLPLAPAIIGFVAVIVIGFNNLGQLGVIVEGMGTRTVSRYGQPLPWAKGSNPEPTDQFDWNLLWNNIWDAPALWLGFVGGFPWGSLGWLDTILPQFVPFTAMFAISAVTFVAIAGASWKKKTALIVVIVCSWVLPVYILQLGGFIVGEQFQPRYLLPIFAMLVAVTLVRNPHEPEIHWGQFRMFAIWFPLVLAHSVALHTGIRRYTTGFGSGGLDLEYMSEWWWLSLPAFLGANAVWIIGSLSFGTVAWFAFISENRGTRGVQPVGSPVDSTRLSETG